MQYAGWHRVGNPVNETRNVATRPVQSWPSEPCGLALLLTTYRYSTKLEFRTEAQQATARPPAAAPSPRPTLPGCALLEHPHTRAPNSPTRGAAASKLAGQRRGPLMAELQQPPGAPAPVQGPSSAQQHQVSAHGGGAAAPRSSRSDAFSA